MWKRKELDTYMGFLVIYISWKIKSYNNFCIYFLLLSLLSTRPDNLSVNFGISLLFSVQTKQERMAATRGGVISLNRPLNIISVKRSSSAEESSQAIRPFISMTSLAVQYPNRLRTLFTEWITGSISTFLIISKLCRK